MTANPAPKSQIVEAALARARSRTSGPSVRAYDPKTMAGWLPRVEVARRLRMSIWGVKFQDGRQFHPALDVNGVRGRRGQWFYDPREVLVAAQKRGRTSVRGLSKGEIAARAFALIDRGFPWQRLVVELEITPQEARTYVREHKASWQDPDPEDPTVAHRREQREHARLVRTLDRELETLGRRRS